MSQPTSQSRPPPPRLTKPREQDDLPKDDPEDDAELAGETAAQIPVVA